MAWAQPTVSSGVHLRNPSSVINRWRLRVSLGTLLLFGLLAVLPAAQPNGIALLTHEYAGYGLLATVISLLCTFYLVRWHRRALRAWLVVPSLLFLTAIVLPTLVIQVGGDKWGSLRTWVIIAWLPVVVYFVVVQVCNNPSRVQLASRVVALAAIVPILVQAVGVWFALPRLADALVSGIDPQRALGQVFVSDIYVDGHIVDWVAQSGIQYVIGTFSHANLLGYYYLGLVPTVLTLRTSESRVWRYIWTAELLVLIVGILFTFSRGVWISAGVVLVSMIIFNGRRARRASLFIILSILIMFFTVPQLNRLALGRFDNLTTWQERFRLAESSLQLWQNAPVFGYGLGQFAIISAETSPLGYGIAPHNEYLLLLVETNLPGLLSFVFLLVCMVLWSAQVYRRSKGRWSREAAAAALGTLLSYGVFILTNPGMSLFLFMMINFGLFEVRARSVWLVRTADG